MEITLGHISIAGLIGILVGLSTLWMRLSTSIKDTTAFRTATEKDIAALQSWRGEHRAQCTTEHAEIRDSVDRLGKQLADVITTQALEAKADRAKLHERLNGLSKEMARLEGRFEETRKP